MKSVTSNRQAFVASVGLFLAVFLLRSSVSAATPQIETQPRSQNVIVGSNAVFKVTANGSPAPSYRWMVNHTNLTNSAHIAGATSATLTISNVTTADNGTYNVVVSNNHGAVLSSNALLTVVFRPAITAQPTDQTARWANPASFSAGVSGTPPFYYQWQKDGVNLTDGNGFTGTRTATLTVSAAPTNAGQYRLIVTNAFGTAQSSNATLFVTPVLAWGSGDGDTNAPASATNLVALDTFFQHTLALRQDGQVIAWGHDMEGETAVPPTATNVIAVAAGNYFSVALREDGSLLVWGDTNSAETVVPADSTNFVAISAGGFSAVGLREDGTLEPWGNASYEQAPIPPFASNIVAVSVGTFATVALRADRTVVAWGDSLYGPTTVPPTATNVIAIAVGAYHALALRADGTMVAWGQNDSGQATVPAEATNIVAVAVGGYHSEALRADGVIIDWGQDGYGQAETPALQGQPVLIDAGAFHSIALLRDPRMQMPPRIWKQPGSRLSVIPGQTIIFHACVLGALPIRYQWLRNGAVLPGETNVWLALAGAQYGQDAGYQFIATNDFGAVTSSVANAHILQPPQVTQDVQPQTVGAGANVTLSVTAVGAAPLYYRWSFNGVPLTDGGSITGSQTSTLQIASAQKTDSGAYSVVITNVAGTASSVAQLAVVPLPVFTIQPQSHTNVSGDAVILQVAASDAQSYQWFFNGAPISDNGRITGTSDTFLSIHVLQTNDAGSYIAIASNFAGAVTSSVATITVLYLPPSFGPPLASQTKVLGGTVAFSSPAAGSLPISYQWYFEGTPLTDNGRVTGSTNDTLNITSLQTNDAGHYWLVASNEVGVTTGAVATLTVLVPPSVILPPTNQTWIYGSNGNLSVLASGSEPLSYQWYLGATLLTDGNRFSGTTTSTLMVTNVQTFDAGYYTAVITNAAGSVTSSVALVSVVVPPSILVQPKGRSSPVGLPVGFNATATGTGTLGYQWQLNGTNILGATLPVYTNSAITTNDFGAYQVVVTNAYGSVTSSVAMLTRGQVAAWGFGGSGQTVLPPGLSNVVAVAAATSFALALKGDGTLVAWGSTAGTNVPASLTNVVAISAGDTYALAVRSDGRVVGWGGPSIATNSSGVSNIISTAGSPNHALGLRAEGTLVEWGSSQSKALIPSGLTQVTSMADGVGFALASRADGSVVTWGSFGQARVIDPTPPILITNAVSVAAGSGFGLALKSDGQVFVWGNPVPTVTNVPVSLTNVTAIACNEFDQNPAYVLALRSNGLITAWGSASSLGPTNLPSGLSNVVAVAAGSAYALALVSDDGWPVILRQPVGGTAFSGNQFTLKAKVTSPTPVTYAWSLDGTNIPDATNSSYIISNAQASDAGSYQLTVSNLTGSAVSFPVPVVVIDGAPALLTFPSGTNRPYVGTAFSLGTAVTGSGPMQTQWRLNGQDLPGVTNANIFFTRLRGTDGGSYTFVASNSFGAITSSVALVAPVSVVGWGGGVYGVTNPPINLSNAVAVSLQGDVAEALRADGTVATWGMLGSNVPPYISNVVEVANNTSTFFTLRTDGSVRGWNIGVAYSNSLAGASHVVSIEADTGGTTLLKSDGTVTRILSSGATNFYPQLTNVVALLRDIGSFAALMADGTVTNFYSSTGTVPPKSALTNVYDIAFDTSLGAVLKRDRTVQNWFPFPGPVTNLSNIIGVSDNAGIRSNGTVVLWNFNSNFPQLTNVPPRLANVIAIEGSLRAELAVMGPRDFQPLLLPDALDTTALVVSSHGSPKWYAETKVTHDGLHAAQSAEIGNNTASSMRLWVAGPVAVSFWWKVSSETNHDFLSFSAGGVVLTNISGETDWQQCTLLLPPGNQILQWTYSKDASGSAGQDAGWVDQLAFTPIAPSIITQPADANISGGSNVTFAFTVTATGTPPLSYQWIKDGNILTNGPSPSYPLFNVTRTNSGTYSVVVTNVVGSVTSSNATLVVRVPQLLSAPTFQPDGTITFSSSDSDGSALSSSDVSHLQVQVSSNLVDWVTLPGALTLQNGVLQLQDSGATNAPLRYYRIVETW
jgi:alpha-tubulin suppressor-like RCC1 family protein